MTPTTAARKLAQPTAAAVRPVSPQKARTAGAPIRVQVGAIEARDGATVVTQSFTLPHPLGAVWSLMLDPVAVARCMPGASIDGPPQDGRIKGRLEVKIGPISAGFVGEGTLRTFAADHRQVIEVVGGDRKSGSRVSGSVDYKLTSDGSDRSGGTRVDVVMSYVLAGPLAQIGRSDIVRDVVRRIGEAFAQNLDAQLRDPTATMPIAKLGGISLMMQVLLDRVRAMLGRLSGRRS